MSYTEKYDYRYSVNYQQPVLDELQEDYDFIIDQIDEIVSLWAGFAICNDFKCLTPEYLKSLYNAVDDVDTLYGSFLQNLQTLNQDSEIINFFDEQFTAHEFEFDVMEVIRLSYRSSAGEIPFTNVKSDAADFHQKMLTVQCVAPWKCPPAPDMEVPERPSVVLKVIGLRDPRCASIGFDDVFLSDVLVDELYADEDLKIGDRVIVKIDEWNGFGHYLISPEYYGLAEPNCPCETPETLAEVRYEFDIESERRKHEANHKQNWVKDNFVSQSYQRILDIGRGQWMSSSRKYRNDKQYKKEFKKELKNTYELPEDGYEMNPWESDSYKRQLHATYSQMSKNEVLKQMRILQESVSHLHSKDIPKSKEIAWRVLQDCLVLLDK